MVHFSHFQWLSWFEAFGPALHFWWNPLEHTLHLTGKVLERKAAENLANLSLELLASARDKPWFKRNFNDGCETGRWVVRWWWWMGSCWWWRVEMTVPGSGGKNACSWSFSLVYESATLGCKVTNIISRWVRAMAS